MPALYEGRPEVQSPKSVSQSPNQPVTFFFETKRLRPFWAHFEVLFGSRVCYIVRLTNVLEPAWVGCLAIVVPSWLLVRPMVFEGAEGRALYGIHDHKPDPTGFLNHLGPTVGSGWVTATAAVGHDPSDATGMGFSSVASRAHPVICRISHGYFPNGTIPLPADYDDFARRCSNFVHSSGCNIWVIGNECNTAGEWAFNEAKFGYVSPSPTRIASVESITPSRLCAPATKSCCRR